MPEDLQTSINRLMVESRLDHAHMFAAMARAGGEVDWTLRGLHFVRGMNELIAVEGFAPADVIEAVAKRWGGDTEPLLKLVFAVAAREADVAA